LQSILKRRPSNPMVIAFIALFLAVSGTATAAKLITGRDIARNTITGKHVKDYSLSARDICGSVKGTAGPAGPAGPEGQRGATGAKGERGPQGDRGEKGEAGKDGKDGAPGRDGKDGLNGKDGVNGKDGKDGEPGLRGLPGQDGKDGKDGLIGKDGLNGKDGKDGAPGLPGQDGLNGKDGKDGAPGFNGVTRVDVEFSIPPSSHGTNAVASCPPATPLVVGGGFRIASEPLAEWVQTYSTYPDTNGSWKVRLGNTGNSIALPATVYALCVAG
jgi:hypothetical protein